MGTQTQATRTVGGRTRVRAALVVGALLAVIAAGIALPGGSAAEQASDPTSPAAAQIDAGRNHTCALLTNGNVRCWGFSREGQLGYSNKNTIGDDETPASAGPVDLGAGRTATAISAGEYHTCAILDDQTVRCWGFGGNGRLGYGTQDNVGDDEPAGSKGPVPIGTGDKAKAIAAGGSHTCAILLDNSVRCWGYAFYGELGYGNPDPDPNTPTTEPPPENVGDDEPAGDKGPVNLGANRTAKAITAGDLHTCAILDNDAVKCWGYGANGQLGYGNQLNLGDRDTPASVPGTVDLGANRTARAISAGVSQTCAVLNDGTVRCWGFGGNGRLGYGNAGTVGDTESPGSVDPVNLGANRTAKAIGVGDGHACTILDDDNVRCWGFGIDGRLGYGAKADIGDNEVPGSVGPVDLGAGRTARAIALGGRHTCARLDDGNVRCWGYGGNGRLGYCNERNIGDTEAPGSVGPVNLGEAGSNAPGCAPPPSGGGSTPGPAPRPAQVGPGVYPLEVEAARRVAYRSCVRRVLAHARREVRRARRLSGARRARLRVHIKRHRARLRAACVRRHGRRPGRVTGLRARAVSRRRIVLTFSAPGSDGSRAPAARSYVVKQSRRPIRSSRGFRRAQTLCRGVCRFRNVTEVGARITLTVTDLRRRTTYYYAVAARDNVTGRIGRRSRPAKARTR